MLGEKGLRPGANKAYRGILYRQGSAIVARVSQRRSFGGPRREASERVVIRKAPDSADQEAATSAAEPATAGLATGQLQTSPPGDEEADAWTLNVSRGGCRVVVEAPVTVGATYEVQVGEMPFRPARVAWVRDEADGQIAGLQFLDVEAGEVPGSSDPPQ